MHRIMCVGPSLLIYLELLGMPSGCYEICYNISDSLTGSESCRAALVPYHFLAAPGETFIHPHHFVFNIGCSEHQVSNII